MLDQIIENIIQRIRKEVVQPGMNEIPLSYLFTRNIPHSIKHFFDQEVELWIREEQQKFTSSERFDYEIPEVQVLMDKIFDTLKQTATFHLNQFNRLLERAIKLEANYLIRPHQTLSQFLFKDNFVITTIEVYDMLKYFDKFEYYKDALTDYFNLKYLREISQTQFEELITAIDQQVFKKTPLETTLQTVKTINSFINEGRSSPSDIMPVQILIMIFRDRNLDEYARLMEQETAQGTEEISFVQLEQVLSTGKSLAELTLAQQPEASRIDKIADIETEKPAVEVDAIDVSETAEAPPLLPEVEEEEPEEEYQAPEIIEKEAEEAPRESPLQTADVSSTSPTTTAVEQLADLVSQKMKGDHLEDINALITHKQQKKFIKKIFRRQEQQYREFLTLLNGTSSWKHASNLIDSFFYQQGINPYSKEALEFSDIVYNRYFPKDISSNKGEEFRY